MWLGQRRRHLKLRSLPPSAVCPLFFIYLPFISFHYTVTDIPFPSIYSDSPVSTEEFLHAKPTLDVPYFLGRDPYRSPVRNPVSHFVKPPSGVGSRVIIVYHYVSDFESRRTEVSGLRLYGVKKK